MLNQVEETDPNFMSPHRELKYIYLEMGDCPTYLVEARREATSLRDAAGLAVADAADHAYATGGGSAMLQAVREQLLKAGANRFAIKNGICHNKWHETAD